MDSRPWQPWSQVAHGVVQGCFEGWIAALQPNFNAKDKDNSKKLMGSLEEDKLSASTMGSFAVVHT